MEPVNERKSAHPVFWGGMIGFGVVLLVVCLAVYFASQSLFSSWHTNRPDPTEAGSTMWGSGILVPTQPDDSIHERKSADPVFWGGMIGFGVVLLVVCLAVYFAFRSLFSSWHTNRPDPTEAGSAIGDSGISVPTPPEDSIDERK